MLFLAGVLFLPDLGVLDVERERVLDAERVLEADLERGVVPVLAGERPRRFFLLTGESVSFFFKMLGGFLRGG